MDADTLLLRLGQSLRDTRKRRGLTQALLAQRAGLPRRKVIQAEQGDGSVSMQAYAQLAAALGVEFAVVPARRPTLDEIAAVLAHGG